MKQNKWIVPLVILFLPIAASATIVKTVEMPFSGGNTIIEDKGDAIKVERYYYEIKLELDGDKLNICDPILKADTVWYDKRKESTGIWIWDDEAIVDTFRIDDHLDSSFIIDDGIIFNPGDFTTD